MSTRGGRSKSKARRSSRIDMDAPLSKSKLPRRSTRLQTILQDKLNRRPAVTTTTIGNAPITTTTTTNNIQVETPNHSVELVLDDSFVDNLKVEIDTTFKTISKITQILSSDEEEIIEINESNHVIDPSAVFISDESDIEEIPYHLPDESLQPDISQPSTSYAANLNTRSENDEVMEQLGQQEESHNLKNLQELQKETEELLKNTAASLEEFNTNKPKQPPIKEIKETVADVPKSSSGLTKTCPICLDPLFSSPTVSTICGHIYCEECIKAVIQRSKKCPTCRKALTLKKIHPIYL